MKIALAMIICSALYQKCLPPYPIPGTYNNHYDCMIAGYEESHKKLKEIGKEEINNYRTFIKFICAEIKEPKTDA
jgi:hypothetical protein